jgi:putative transposase
MKKEDVLRKFSKEIFVEYERKNKVKIANINSTLIVAAIEAAFVNESCKSTGKIKKSQIIYRKLKGKSREKIREYFKKCTIRFLRMLKIFSRNRKFIISFDLTKEAFYGKFTKAKDTKYLHAGKVADGSTHYYEYLTVAITSNEGVRYVLDAIIVPRGAYIEDYVQEMVGFVKQNLLIEIVLFDRGFDNWGLILKLQELKVDYLIFWRKQGKWYKETLNGLKESKFGVVKRTEKYKRNKSGYKVVSDFIIVKQLEYEGKKYDWIFASSRNYKSSGRYVKTYKKRWGIETIYRVTDKIRIYTTSTNSLLRYFLFLFTCLVYNLWKFFQSKIEKDFTLANFKVNMIFFMAKYNIISPIFYTKFKKLSKKTKWILTL